MGRSIPAVALAAVAAVVVAASSAGAPVKTGCTLSGVRYVGSTSQKQQLCFTLSTDGRKLSEYAYNFRDDCGGKGNLRTTNASRGYLVPLSANGAFSHSVSSSYFKGTVSGGKATGTLRNRGYVAGLNTTCDTGVVRWTAHRVG